MAVPRIGLPGSRLVHLPLVACAAAFHIRAGLGGCMEAYVAKYVLQVHAGFFYDRLQEGRSPVLLDSLDVAALASHRACVTPMVSAFPLLYAPAGAPHGLGTGPRHYDEVASHL